MAEFESLKKEIESLKKILEIERRDYDRWFKSYHRMHFNYWNVIVKITLMLGLDNFKQMNVRPCCLDIEDNPIYKKLDELLKKVGDQ